MLKDYESISTLKVAKEKARKEKGEDACAGKDMNSLKMKMRIAHGDEVIGNSEEDGVREVLR
jgi:hypothetical protein